MKDKLEIRSMLSEDVTSLFDDIDQSRVLGANAQIKLMQRMMKSVVEHDDADGIESVRRNAPIAALEDQTVEGFAAAKRPKFEMYVDNAGEFRFRLKATNGEIIAASEGYKAKESCENGIQSVRENAPVAEMVEE